MISGAIGSLYIVMVPSTVTDTFIPRDRGTARGGKKNETTQADEKNPCKLYELNITMVEIPYCLCKAQLSAFTFITKWTTAKPVMLPNALFLSCKVDQLHNS